MTKDERKEQKRKEAFRKWARQHAKLRRNLRKHGGDILQSGNFKSTNSFIQHGSVSVHSHSIRVAECSLKLEKFLEKLGIHCHERDLVRGALLHDYFLYDWHDKYSHEKLHGFHHPNVALENASREYQLTPREREVLQALVTSDKTAQEIAHEIGMSRAAFYRHIASLNEKTGTKARVGLLQFYYNDINGK